MKLKISEATVVMYQDWNDFVSSTYGRPYDFQQQDGCKRRGIYQFSVPCTYYDSDRFEEAGEPDYTNESIPEELGCGQKGVMFSSWLSRDPSKGIKAGSVDMRWALDRWWERNFYPSIEMVANDLHSRGLLEAGEYVIVIDW